MVKGETWLVDIRKFDYHLPVWHRNRVVKIRFFSTNTQVYSVKILLRTKWLGLFKEYAYDEIGVENINFVRRIR